MLFWINERSILFLQFIKKLICYLERPSSLTDIRRLAESVEKNIFSRFKQVTRARSITQLAVSFAFGAPKASTCTWTHTWMCVTTLCYDKWLNLWVWKSDDEICCMPFCYYLLNCENVTYLIL